MKGMAFCHQHSTAGLISNLKLNQLKLLLTWTIQMPLDPRKQTKPKTNQKGNEDGKRSCRISAVFAKTQG